MLTVKLSEPIYVEKISIEHAARVLLLNEGVSAPKDFSIIGETLRDAVLEPRFKQTRKKCFQHFRAQYFWNTEKIEYDVFWFTGVFKNMELFFSISDFFVRSFEPTVSRVTVSFTRSFGCCLFCSFVLSLHVLLRATPADQSHCRICRSPGQLLELRCKHVSGEDNNATNGQVVLNRFANSSHDKILKTTGAVMLFERWPAGALY